MGIAVYVVQIDPKRSQEVVLDRLFEKEEITVGRSPKCDVPLPAPDVSGTHAKLTITSGENGEAQLFVTDLNRSNGTSIEDQALEAEIATAVEDGKRIIIGEFLISAHIVSQEKEDSVDIQGAIELEDTIEDFSPEEEAIENVIVAEGEDEGEDDAEEIEAVADEQAVEEVSGTSEIEQVELAPPSQKSEELLLSIWNELSGKHFLLEASVEDLSQPEQKEGVFSDLEKIIDKSGLEDLEKATVAKLALDELLKFGPITSALSDNSVRSITLNGPRDIAFEREDSLEQSENCFSCDEALTVTISRLLKQFGHNFHHAQPVAEIRLGNGTRIFGVASPLASPGSYYQIRKPDTAQRSLKELTDIGYISKKNADSLRAAIDNQKSLAIVGPSGSGKTQLLGALLDLVDPEERIIAVEELGLLKLPQGALSFVAQPLDEVGGELVSTEELVYQAVIAAPSLLVVDDCKSQAYPPIVRHNQSEAGWSLVAFDHRCYIFGEFDGASGLESLRSGPFDLAVQTCRPRSGSCKVREIVALN